VSFTTSSTPLAFFAWTREVADYCVLAAGKSFIFDDPGITLHLLRSGEGEFLFGPPLLSFVSEKSRSRFRASQIGINLSLSL